MPKALITEAEEKFLTLGRSTKGVSVVVSPDA
jgi:hypothetical protein